MVRLGCGDHLESDIARWAPSIDRQLLVRTWLSIALQADAIGFDHTVLLQNAKHALGDPGEWYKSVYFGCVCIGLG